MIIQLCFDVLINAGGTPISFGEVPPSFPVEFSTIPSGQLTPSEYQFATGTVTFTDAQVPTISCPPDTTLVGSAPIAIGNLDFMAMDNCGIDSTGYTITGATTGTGSGSVSGTLFNEGISTVTYTTLDFAGNTASCSFNVDVTDNGIDTILNFEPLVILDCDHDTVCVRITVSNFDSIESMQFAMEWDPTTLDFLEVQDSLPASGTYNSAFTSTGRLILIWFHNTTDPGLTLNDGDAIAVIKFLQTGTLVPPVITFNDPSLPFIPIEISNSAGRLDSTDYRFLPGQIILDDPTPPVFANCPTDITIPSLTGSCGSNASWTIPTATDDCDASVDVVASANPGDFFPVGATMVTYVATNDAGLTSTCSFTITVEDNTPPSLVCPSDLTVNTDVGICSAVVNGLALSGLSDPCGVDTIFYQITGASMGDGTGADASGFTFSVGVNTVTYFAVDPSGNTGSCSFSVTVEDNEAPTLACPVDQTAIADFGTCMTQINSIDPVSASDNCGVDTTYVITGATMSSGTGSASGTFFEVGISTLTYTVTDPSGNSASCSLTINITDDQLPDVFCPGDQTVSADPGDCFARVTGIGPLSTVDNCGVDSVYYVLGGLSSGTGANDASGNSFPVGPSTVTYIVQDLSGNTNSCTFNIFVEDDEAPMIDCPIDMTLTIPPIASSVLVNSIDPTITENCPGGLLEFTKFHFNSSTTTTGTGSASGTSFDPGVTEVTYTFTDAAGSSATCTFLVTVIQDNNDLIDCPADTTVSTLPTICGAPVNDIDPLYLVSPSSLSSINHTLTGATVGADTLFASGTLFNLGITTVTYFVESVLGELDTCSFTVTVIDDVAPAYDLCPSDITVAVDQAGCLGTAIWTEPTVSDNCGVVSNVSNFNSGDGFPLGNTTVEYVARDAAGLADTCTFMVTVIDTVPPTLLSCPADTIVDLPAGDCSINFFFQTPAFDDFCPLTFSGNSIPGETFNIGTRLLVFTATDASGNETTCTYNVTVRDTTPPVIGACPPTDITFTPVDGCRAVVDWTPPTGTDDCGMATVTGTSNPLDTFDFGSTTVVYVVTDESGNFTTCSFNVEVEDTQAPTITNCPTDITVNTNPGTCTGQAFWGEPQASDNCGIVSFTSNFTPGTIFNEVINIVTYTAVDQAGNTATCSFTVTLQDDLAPVLDCEDIVVNADGTIVSDPAGLLLSASSTDNCTTVKLDFNFPTATDNCPGMVTITQTDATSLTTGSSFPIDTTILEFTATDLLGNSSTCNVSVIVLPLEAVVISAVPNMPCEGESLQLLTNFQNGTSYLWTGPTGITYNEPSPIIDPITSELAGTYTVEVTLQSSCVVSSTVVVDVNPAPQILIENDSPFCDGDIFLSASPADGSVGIGSYFWTTPSGAIINDSVVTINNAAASDIGIYTVTAVGANGCETTQSTNVSVAALQVSANTDCGEVLCEGASCTLFGSVTGFTPDSVIWEATPTIGSGLPNNPGQTVDITPTIPGLYFYNFYAISGGCISDTATIVLIVAGDPIGVDTTWTTPFETTLEDFNVTTNDTLSGIVDFSINVVQDVENGTLTNNGDGTFTYEPDAGFIGQDFFIYELCNLCIDGGCTTAIETIDVQFEGFECEVPNLISPNSDGRNDEVFINCIESGSFPSNELQIFNQWGDEVFSASPYRNDWRGTHDGEDLPDGTYYYIFKVDPNAEPMTGFITIFR